MVPNDPQAVRQIPGSASAKIFRPSNHRRIVKPCGFSRRSGGSLADRSDQPGSVAGYCTVAGTPADSMFRGESAEWGRTAQGACMLAYTSRVWQYRYFWGSLVRMDMRNRYRGSLLGASWTLLHPLAMSALLCFVFSKLFGRSIEDFLPTLMSGFV